MSIGKNGQNPNMFMIRVELTLGIQKSDHLSIYTYEVSQILCKQMRFKLQYKYRKMSRLGLSASRNSRGSSRGIMYGNIMKNSGPMYGSSSIKKQSQYDTKLLKSQQPASSSNYSKMNQRKQYNYNNYDYLLNTKDVKLSEKLNSEAELKRQKDRNKEFRIRANLRDKQSSTTLKNWKDDENQQKTDKYEGLKKQEKEKDIVTYSQKEKQLTTSTTTSSKYQNSKTIGLVGLNNIGNTCFMNSILQCVFNLPGFNQYFLEDQHVGQLKSNSKVAQAYAKMIKTMRLSTSRSETPSQLKSAIGSKKSRFLGYSQQDAQQFLAALLELLSQDLNRSSKPKYRQLTADTSKHTLEEISQQWWSYNKQRQDSVVCDYFTGQILSKVVCSKCKHQSIAFDNIWDMALNFSSGDGGKVNKMIQNFLKEETISNDYYCAKCKSFRECKRKIDFYRLPKILVFQLKRFSYGRWRKVKLNNYVSIESTLNLGPLIKESKHQSVKNPVYNLVGMVNHSGDIDFGHYTAECKNPINKKWYNFNDSHVSETRMRQSFQSSSPYLLFYAKDE